MSDGNELTGLFGIHSQKEGMPAMRGWAKSKEAAEELLEKIKASDEVPEDEYWILEMSRAEVDSHKAVGYLPADV